MLSMKHIKHNRIGDIFKTNCWFFFFIFWEGNTYIVQYVMNCLKVLKQLKKKINTDISMKRLHYI